MRSSILSEINDCQEESDESKDSSSLENFPIIIQETSNNFNTEHSCQNIISFEEQYQNMI